MLTWAVFPQNEHISVLYEQVSNDDTYADLSFAVT